MPHPLRWDTPPMQALDLKRLQGEKSKYAIEAAEAQSKFSNALDEV